MSLPNLADILARITDGLCVFDRSGRITFANDKASQLLQTVDAAFHDRIAQAIKDNVTTRFESFHGNLKQWFEHQTHPDPEGGLTLFSRDVTSRRRLEEALRASKERFRRLMDSDIIGMLVVESGVIVEANDVFLSMIGYTREDMVTKKLRWRELTPPEYDSVDATARSEIANHGGFAPYEKEFIRKNGSRVPVFIGGVAIHNEPAETLCLALDLSQRKRAEERMRALVVCGRILASSLECEKTFPETAEFIATHLADACLIFIKDEDGLIGMAAAHRTPLTALTALDDSEIQHVLSSGRIKVSDFPVSRLLAPIITGTEVTGVLAAVSAKPYAFDSDDIHFFDVIGRRAGLALDNSRLYHEAQKANRLKDEFVAIVSHELRTPLTPILGGVYMLRSDFNDPNVAARALELIERNAKAQVKIVDDLLDISRALSGKLRLNIEPVDLVAVINAAVETIRPASEAKNIHIDLQIGKLEGGISGDADRLQQIVWNLLANSVKFTPPNGRIFVKLSQMGNHAEIGVTDSGIGIQAEFLPHVFDRFRQADASRTRVHGGLGLGLAIVRQLVESHGGTVQAHSSGDEQGATFIVRLPLKPNARSASTA